MNNLFFILLASILIAPSTYAQSQLTLLNRSIINRYDPILNKKEVDFHTASKPYEISRLKAIQTASSVEQSLISGATSPLIYHFKNENLLNFKKGILTATADPVLTMLTGYETGRTKRLFESSYGAILNVSLGNKFHFNTVISKEYSLFPAYLDSIVREEQVVPGRSYASRRGDVFHYNNNSGYISYTPIKYFNFQTGYGRNFIGDGYRSLLLSDNSYSYPFFKITTNIWKLQYVNLFTNFKALSDEASQPLKFYNKYGTFHYLSLNIKNLSIGIFEAIIFESRDTSGSKFTYDINYLNPVIFYRPVEYSIGSADNALMGLNLKYKLLNNHVIYGQLMIDEFLLKEIRADIIQEISPDINRKSGWWANKYGFQLGYKWFDFLFIKNMQFQSEYNFVRPFSYTHSSITQNYGHYNQALAHPIGANFKEMIFFLRYFIKRFSFEAKWVYVDFGADTEAIYYGRDIYRSYIKRPYDYGHTTGQGIKTNLLISDIKISYLINPKNNLQIELGYTNRLLKQNQLNNNQQTHFIYAGIRTALFNWYYDR